MLKTDYKLTVGWLYPELMSTYGDRGNIMVLKKRALWHKIELQIIPIEHKTTLTEMRQLDLIFGGGAQDIEQEIVMQDLRDKGSILRGLIEGGRPALFVCGSPQLMGNYYEPAVGKRIEGLGIFDMISIHPGSEQKRLIGNTAAQVEWKNLKATFIPESALDSLIFGFENHGGRTYLGPNALPFAKILRGYGNNGEDETEGVVYKNAIGCYFHGPLLPKNPQVADFLLKRSLEVKYKEEVVLKKLDDLLETQAREAIANKLGVRV